MTGILSVEERGVREAGSLVLTSYITGTIMCAMEPLCSLMNINSEHLTKKEFLLLEAVLFFLICEELKEFFRNDYHDYFCLLKLSKKEENEMLEINLIRLIMKDILVSGEYTLGGVAHHTDIHEDILIDAFTGNNGNPSANLLRRIIGLHHSIRRDLYDSIIKKIITRY